MCTSIRRNRFSFEHARLDAGRDLYKDCYRPDKKGCLHCGYSELERIEMPGV